MKRAATVILLLSVLVAPAAADDLTNLCSDLIAEMGSITSPDLLQSQNAQVVAERQCSATDAWDTLGAAYSMARRVEPAVYCFAQASKAEPDRGISANNLGFILLNQERYDDAQIALERAYELAPSSPQVQMNLGKLRWRQGEPDAALALLEQAAREDWHPEYPHALAKALYHSDQAERAEQVLDENLRQHPTHEPSLELYQQITGRQWNTAARELAEEALALADEAEEIVRAWAGEIDTVAAHSTGDTPGTQMAQLYLGISDAMENGLRSAMENAHVTDELLAMQALQCYRTQIETIGKVYHGYLACLYVHDAQAARPDLQISPVGGFDFMIDRCAFTEPMYAVRDARNKAGETADEALGENAPPEARKAYYCGLVVPKAKAYAITMPDRIQSVARDLGLAIEQIGRLDDGLLERFDSFHERVEPLVQMAMLKAQVDGQYETMHAFFDPDGSVMLGTAWALEEATDTLEDLAEQHRPHIQDAVKDVEECGKESPVEGPPTFQDFLAALVEANDASDVKFGRKIDLVIMEAKVGLDGSVDFVIGQGLQTVLYHDAAQGSFGVKLGAGVSVETPIIPTGVGGGAYFRFDDTAGPGLEWSASGSAGGVEGTRTETFWFDAHFR